MITYRVLSQEEKKTLKSYQTSSAYKYLYATYSFEGFILFCVLFIVLVGAREYLAPLLNVENIVEYKIYAAVVSLIFSCIWMGYFFIKRIRGLTSLDESDFETSLKEDIKENKAAVEVYEVIDAIEIEEYEDEGTGFFLVLKDKRILCIIGQDLYPYAHDAESQPSEGIGDIRHLFPQTKIEYTYAPKSKIRLDIKGVGEMLRPRALVKSHKKLFSKKGYCGPETDRLYEGPIEDVLNQFGYTEERA